MIQQLTPTERDAIIRDDFPAFLRASFNALEPNKTFEPNWHQEAISETLVQSKGKQTQVFINAPPRSLKSFQVSVAWVAFTLGHDPTHKFICASYSRDLANNLGAQCRTLMQTDFYCRLFNTRLRKITEDELVTTENGYRLSTSVGSTLTGLGGDTLIVDDPLNASDAYSETQRKTQNTWFTDTLSSRTNDKRTAAIFVVCQRLHQEDLTGMLIEKGWKGLVFPAIAPRDTLIEAGRFKHFWKEGEPLQPRESLALLADLKRQLSPAAFAAQYMQDPVPEAGNLLKRDWLKWYEIPPSRQPGDQVVLSIDTAIKIKPTSDYSVCLAFLVRNKNEYYLIDIWRRKVDFPQLCAETTALAAKHRPNAILIEEQASGSPLIDQCRRNGLTGIVGRRAVVDKKTRMNGETAKLEAGSLILPKSAPWLDEFVMELLAFPGGKHDDQIDALSQFLHWRTTAETQTSFSCDFGYGEGSNANGSWARLGAPSPEDFLGHFR
jgi:predicted phage terminase large subunit-like protein